MLEDAKMVGFLITRNYDAARAFYVDKLGFTFVSLDQFALVIRAAGHNIRITRMESFTPPPGTALGWEVADIEREVDRLRAAGIEFAKYPFVPDKERGIWDAPGGSRVAWFKDPDGNVLSLSQHP